MSNLTPANRRASRRLMAPTTLVALFAFAMSCCVLGVIVWKSVEGREAALARSEIDVKNLAHSLAEQTARAIQSADMAMTGMVDLLKYQTPRRDRFDAYLARTVDALPQIREMGVLDTNGNWIYSSLPALPAYNNSDRSYFAYHRDAPSTSLRISEPLVSRLTGRTTVVLSKRISGEDGSFKGVLTAAIDSDYFKDFFSAFNLGRNGGIGLIRRDGIVLFHWPVDDATHNLSGSDLFQHWLPQSSAGYYKTNSSFDGISKYVGYEETPLYPLVVTVAKSEHAVLASWRAELGSEAIVALVLLSAVVLLATILSMQFRARASMEHALREREARYRLLADNVADIVVLLDRDGKFRFVSQSAELILGLTPANLIGISCYSLVHPDDLRAIKDATAQLTDRSVTKTAIFRTWRADGSLAWVEINFRLATSAGHHELVEVVGVLRDVSERKAMEDELKALNCRLAELAAIDGLTGLANRRTFDDFLGREFRLRDKLSVLLFDIDNFKGFNDTLGHQAGDQGLRDIAHVIAETTANTAGLAARYGGEEFAVVLPDIDEGRAVVIAEAVRLKVRALNLANPAASRGFVTVSAGIAGKSPETASDIELLRDADLALYDAKRDGRNRSVLRTQIMDGVNTVPSQSVEVGGRLWKDSALPK